MSSTVATNSNDSEQSDEVYSVKTEPSVIPRTTIVCMPNIVTVPSLQQQHLQSSSYSNSTTIGPSGSFHPHKLTQSQFQPSQYIYSDIETVSVKSNPNRILSQPIQFSQANQIAQQLQQRHQVMSKRKSHGRVFQHYINFYFNQLQKTQLIDSERVIARVASPLAVTRTTSQLASAVSSVKQPKIPGKGGRGSRSNNNRPPPGAVNLERSYQICQAVIQNSPNRHQLKAQLRPPPSMLASTNNNTSASSSNTTNDKRDDAPATSISNRVIYKVSTNQVNHGKRQLFCDITPY